MKVSEELGLTLEDHRQAFEEVSFLLEIFATTVHDLMGGATDSVGRIAGREMAKKLPLYIPNPTLEDVLAQVAGRMEKGFEIRFTSSGGGADLTFERCALRDVCRVRGLALGGPLCSLFRSYLDGLVNELVYRPVKSRIISTGERCELRLEVR
jgi:hypothetical protein